MVRYTDDLRAARAIREPQARHDAAARADVDGLTAADHLTELERSVGNLKRAVNAGVPGSVIFEAGQVTARCRAITGLAKVQELLS